MTARRYTTALVLMAALGASTLARRACAQDETGEFEDASRRLLSEEVFSDTPVDFALPQSLEDVLRPPRAVKSASAFSLGVTGSMVLTNEEQGASKEFAGSGTGNEYGVSFRHRNGWKMHLAVSQIEEGLYSSIDQADARLDRYLFGADFPLFGSKAFKMILGGGVAWNQLDIDIVDESADIAGPGGFVDLGMTIALGGHVEFYATGRMLYWQGQDGTGATGSEQSTVVLAGVSLSF